MQQNPLIHQVGRNPEMNRQASAEIKQQTEAYLASGGQIREIPFGIGEGNCKTWKELFIAPGKKLREEQRKKRELEEKTAGAATPAAAKPTPNH